MQPTVGEPATKFATDTEFNKEIQDFSLVLGGPIFQLLRRARLAGVEGMQLVHRRVIGSILLAWLPLLVLCLFRPTTGSSERVSFFRDFEVHARFLVALPILIFAELLVHLRLRAAVGRFAEWRIVTPEDLPGFQRAIQSALKIRNSLYVELALAVFVYVSGLWLWNDRPILPEPTWYTFGGSRWALTSAGYWYVFISIPVFQFILLRWYMRLFIWFRFLWQVNRLNLNLIPSHPDRCGGLSFVGKSSYAFGPILFAQGAILAGILAGRVIYGGESLMSFKVQIIGFVAFFVVAVLAPLLMFVPRMARTKRKGLADYGLFAQRYVQSFNNKWIQPQPSSHEEALGSGDIQSLADLAGSYDIIREMRVVPFGLQDISRLAIATAAPFAPLLLTIFSAEELLLRALKVVF
jgi:hypothetical protein